MPLNRTPPHVPSSNQRSTGNSQMPIERLSVLRGRRTRVRNALQKDLEAVRRIDVATDEDRGAIHELRVRIDAHIAMLREFDALISGHPEFDEADTEREIDDSLEGYELGLQAQAAVIALLRPVRGRQNGDTGEQAASESSTTTNSNDTNGHQATVLAQLPPPTIDITPELFDGRTSRYKLWRAQFDNWLAKHTSATGRDRLVALIKFLRGPPRSLIESLALTDENFKVAVTLLDQNYAAEGFDSREVIEGISSAPVVHSRNDMPGSRKLLVSTQRTVLAMQVLNVPLNEFAIPFEAALRKAVPDGLIFEHEELLRLAPANTIGSDNAGSTGHDVAALVSGAAASRRVTALLDFLHRYVNSRESLSAPGAFQIRQLSDSSGLVEGALFKVLGIAWAPAEDQFRFRFAKLTQSVNDMKTITKRSILQIIAQIYDPVGWLLPFVLRGKLIIQLLWMQAMSWDDAVDGEVVDQFRKWATELTGLVELRIPRLYGCADRSATSHQLFSSPLRVLVQGVFVITPFCPRWARPTCRSAPQGRCMFDTRI